MKRFNLIDSVKSLMSNYSNERGDQYFNIGMTTEFNSQWDHSNYQSLYLGLYNLSSELRMLISNRWSWPSLFAFNIFSVRPANSGLFYL